MSSSTPVGASVSGVHSRWRPLPAASSAVGGRQTYGQDRRARVTMSVVSGGKSAAALYSSLLQRCISSNAFRQGKSVHHRIVASAAPPDLHLSTKLVIFYARFGDVAAARKVFDGMPHRSIVSWTAMLSGYAKNRCPREALELFALMLRSGARPNQFTFGSAANACGGAGCARSGEQVHACAAKGRFAGDMFVQSALMDMHLRCGSVADARRLFAEMERKDLVSWNALIRGFVERGHYSDALVLLSSMLKNGMLHHAILIKMKCFCPFAYIWAPQIHTSHCKSPLLFIQFVIRFSFEKN